MGAEASGIGVEGNVWIPSTWRNWRSFKHHRVRLLGSFNTRFSHLLKKNAKISKDNIYTNWIFWGEMNIFLDCTGDMNPIFFSSWIFYSLPEIPEVNSNWYPNHQPNKLRLYQQNSRPFQSMTSIFKFGSLTAEKMLRWKIRINSWPWRNAMQGVLAHHELTQHISSQKTIRGSWEENHVLMFLMLFAPNKVKH